MSMVDAEHGMQPDDIRDSLEDADTVPGDTGDGIISCPADAESLQDSQENASDGADEQETASGVPGAQDGGDQAERQISPDDGGEMQRLDGELSAVTAERDALRAQCETLGAEAETLRGDCERLENEVASLRDERDRLIVSALCQMGAVDGEYLLDRLRKDGVTDCEQIFKQVKSRFPQLFRHKLDGIRPAGSAAGEVVSPAEMSFSERMRQYAEDPEGSARRFR